LVTAFWGNLLSASLGYKGGLNNEESSSSWRTGTGIAQSELMALKELFYNEGKKCM
jgi:hypothetical protein